MKKKLLALYCSFVIFIGCTLADTEKDQVKGAQSMMQLKALIPSDLKNPSRETVILMEEVGRTRRLDACKLLIRALAFNFDPDQSDELLSHAEHIPTINCLKRNYGPESLTLLFSEGISTNKPWMRERCALAVRSLASPEQIKAMRRNYSLDSARGKAAKQFDELISRPKLIVRLYSARQELLIRMKK